MVTGAEAGTSVQVNVSPHSEIVQRIGEEYPFILDTNINKVFLRPSNITSTLRILPVSRA